MDAWMAPNHKAFVAVTVHLECDGVLLALLLDIVEVPRVSIDLQHCQNIEMFVLVPYCRRVRKNSGRIRNFRKGT